MRGGDATYEYIDFERSVARTEVKNKIDQSETEKEIQVLTSEAVEKEEVEFSENPAYDFDAEETPTRSDDDVKGSDSAVNAGSSLEEKSVYI